MFEDHAVKLLSVPMSLLIILLYVYLLYLDVVLQSL